MINRKRLLKFSVATVISVFPMTIGNAATISFNSAVNIDLSMPTQVVNNGSVVRAYSFGSLPTSTFVVNGVTFSSFASQLSDTTSFPITNQIVGFAPNMTNSYGALLNNGFFSEANVNSTITLNSLTIGQTYQLQFFVHDSRGEQQNRAENFGGLSPAVQFGLGSPSMGGQYSIGTFTADSTSQNITLEFTRDVVTQANALTLSAVPEPSTYLFLGFGALALIGVTNLRKN